MKCSVSALLACAALCLAPLAATAQNAVNLPQRIVLTRTAKAQYNSPAVQATVGVGVGSGLRIVGVDATLTLAHEDEEGLIEFTTASIGWYYCWIDQVLQVDFDRIELNESEAMRLMAGSVVEGTVEGEIIAEDPDGNEVRIPFCGSDTVEVYLAGTGT